MNKEISPQVPSLIDKGMFQETSSEVNSFTDPRGLLFPHPELSQLLYIGQESLENRLGYDQRSIKRTQEMSEEMQERCEQAEEIRVKEEEEQRRYKAAMKAVYGMQWGEIPIVDNKRVKKEKREEEEFEEIKGSVTAASISALEEIEEQEQRGEMGKTAGIAIATILAGNLLLSACTPAEATNTPTVTAEPTQQVESTVDFDSSTEKDVYNQNLRLSIIPDLGIEREGIVYSQESREQAKEDNEFYDYLVKKLDENGNPWKPVKKPLVMPQDNYSGAILNEQVSRESSFKLDVLDTIPVSYTVPSTITQEALNQGACGACGAFSLGETLRMQLALEKGKNFDPSEAYLFFCMGKYPGTCDTGWAYHVGFNAFEDGEELVDEECFPYGSAIDGIDRDCAEACQDPEETMSIKGYQYIFGSESQLLSYIAETGNPVIFGMHVYESFYYYDEGIYEGRVGPDDPLIGGHGLVLIGYNTEEKYWLVRNSWGPDWGENGNARLKMRLAPDDKFVEGFGTNNIAIEEPYLVDDEVITHNIFIPLVINNN